MDTTGGAQDFGLDAWTRSFREAMAAFAPAAPAVAGVRWPDAGAWPGLGAMPGMGAGLPGMFSTQAGAGPFAGLFEQFAGLAQSQWQQFANHAAGGMGGADDVPGYWQRFAQSMTAASPPPALDTTALREALSTPQVGPMREHVERWQQAMLAQLDYQDASRAFAAQLSEISKLTLDEFSRRVAARAEPDKQMTSMRELFDEWIEAGEAVWAERANDDAFTRALGQYTNAQMRLRAAQADQINRMAQSLGLPTRDEVDSDHRRIAQLERELRRVQREMEGLRAAAEAAVHGDAAQHTPGGSKHAAEAPAKTAPRKPAAKKTPAKKAATRRKNVATKAATKSHDKVGKGAGPEQKKPKAGAARTTRPTTGTPRRAGATSFPLVTAPRAVGKTARKSAGKTTSNKRAAT